MSTAFMYSQDIIVSFGNGATLAVVKSVVVVVEGSWKIGENTKKKYGGKPNDVPSPITSNVARESSLFTATSSPPVPTSSPFHFSDNYSR